MPRRGTSSSSSRKNNFRHRNHTTTGSAEKGTPTPPQSGAAPESRESDQSSWDEAQEAAREAVWRFVRPKDKPLTIARLAIQICLVFTIMYVRGYAANTCGYYVYYYLGDYFGHSVYTDNWTPHLQELRPSLPEQQQHGEHRQQPWLWKEGPADFAFSSTFVIYAFILRITYFRFIIRGFKDNFRQPAARPHHIFHYTYLLSAAVDLVYGPSIITFIVHWFDDSAFAAKARWRLLHSIDNVDALAVLFLGGPIVIFLLKDTSAGLHAHFTIMAFVLFSGNWKWIYPAFYGPLVWLVSFVLYYPYTWVMACLSGFVWLLGLRLLDAVIPLWAFALNFLRADIDCPGYNFAGHLMGDNSALTPLACELYTFLLFRCSPVLLGWIGLADLLYFPGHAPLIFCILIVYFMTACFGRDRPGAMRSPLMPGLQLGHIDGGSLFNGLAILNAALVGYSLSSGASNGTCLALFCVSLALRVLKSILRFCRLWPVNPDELEAVGENKETAGSVLGTSVARIYLLVSLVRYLAEMLLPPTPGLGALMHLITLHYLYLRLALTVLDSRRLQRADDTGEKEDRPWQNWGTYVTTLQLCLAALLTVCVWYTGFEAPDSIPWLPSSSLPLFRFFLFWLTFCYLFVKAFECATGERDLQMSSKWASIMCLVASTDMFPWHLLFLSNFSRAWCDALMISPHIARDYNHHQDNTLLQRVYVSLFFGEISNDTTGTGVIPHVSYLLAGHACVSLGLMLYFFGRCTRARLIRSILACCALYCVDIYMLRPQPEGLPENSSELNWQLLAAFGAHYFTEYGSDWAVIGGSSGGGASGGSAAGQGETRDKGRGKGHGDGGDTGFTSAAGGLYSFIHLVGQFLPDMSGLKFGAFVRRFRPQRTTWRGPFNSQKQKQQQQQQQQQQQGDDV
eukprot:UC1_evm2s1478